MTEAYVRRLFDQYAARYDAALTEQLDYRGPAILRDAVEDVMRAAGTADAFRLHARPRLRHRARRRRVSPVRRLARRRRSVAGDDRAGAREGPVRPAGQPPTSRHFLAAEAATAREISSRRSPPTSSSMSAISRRSWRRSRACSRRTACSPSRSRPIRRRREAAADVALRPWRGLHPRARSRDAGLDGAAALAKPRCAPKRACRCDGLVVVASTVRICPLGLARERSRTRRAAARAVRALVRQPRLDAARASARAPGEGARRPLGAADRADRRRQDAGRISAEPGGAERTLSPQARRSL